MAAEYVALLLGKRRIDPGGSWGPRRVCVDFRGVGEAETPAANRSCVLLMNEYSVDRADRVVALLEVRV